MLLSAMFSRMESAWDDDLISSIAIRISDYVEASATDMLDAVR